LVITGLRTLAVAVLSTLVVAGCGGSGYTYHSNRDENLYFKLPDDWTVFDGDDIPTDALTPGMWVRGFMAGEEPSVDGVFALAAAEPRGFVFVEPLDVMERDTVSLRSLRGTLLGTDATGEPLDPLAYAEQFPEQLQILGYDGGVVYDHGPHGVHLRVAISPPGEETAVIDQLVLVDAGTSRMYVLSIGCSLECFEAHEREIEEVIDSWTLEAT